MFPAISIPLTVWSFSLAALLFGGLALSELGRARTGPSRVAFQVALALTALWALAVAGIGPTDVMSIVAEGVRNLAWLGFMMALMRGDGRQRGAGMVLGVYGIVALIVVGSAALAIARTATHDPGVVAAIDAVATVLAMMISVTALVLVHHLYNAVAPGARGGIRLAVLGLAAMWASDLTLATLAYLEGAQIAVLAGLRGVALVAIAPLFALAVHRNGDWTLRLSRTVAYQSLTLAAVALYVGLMALATSAIAAMGGTHARLLQTAFILGSTTALITFVSSPWLRAWVKVKLAKHLFSHRYDYRAEWLRFTDTLGKPGEGAAPLEQRVIKAIADLTDSPAALLLVPEGSALGQGMGWNWPEDAALGPVPTTMLADFLARTGRIVELDAIRDRSADDAELAAVPRALIDWPDAWVLAPLLHLDQLTGVVVLARPPLDRRPDWEDLDLLRLAGRHVASYLAEARAHQALAEAQRFDEFNRRFAFILHDIKNLVSQLTLVARNAERHADNPEFRADMVATLQDSAARMNDLLARLSQHHGGRADMLAPVAVMPVVEDVAQRRRGQHPVTVSGKADLLAMADGARLAKLLAHLVQNAAEASRAEEPVLIAVSEVAGGDVAIDVVDHGCGMSPAFIRDRLFKPFVSSKPNGFGLGAFEARQLAEAMGGSVTVASREGEGTRFRITLRAPRSDGAATGTISAANLGKAA